jgi:hypothetical protein
MSETILRDLPIQLAIRLVLDSISYSNPLPPWFDSVTIDYKKRERTIGNKIIKYLNGERPVVPFQIELPKKTGGKSRGRSPRSTIKSSSRQAFPFSQNRLHRSSIGNTLSAIDTTMTQTAYN